MFMVKPFFIILLLFNTSVVLGETSVVDPKKEITWVIADMPPHMIGHGPFKGKGTTGYILDLLIEALPQYHHKKKYIEMLYAYRVLMTGEDNCLPGLLKVPKVSAYRYFSDKPSVIILPHEIILRRKDVDRFGGGKPLSLDRLISENQFQLGIVKNRSHGEVLDNIINSYPTDSGHYKIYKAYTGKNINLDIMVALLNNRLDYTIGYPEELKFVGDEFDGNDQLTSIPIEEQPEYLEAFVNCTDNEWGRDIIRQINPIIEKKEFIKAVRTRITNWLPENSKQRYKAIHTRYYGPMLEE